jgi:hypothetical protein
MVFSFDNLSAEVVHGVFEFVGEEQHGGTNVPPETGHGAYREASFA